METLQLNYCFQVPEIEVAFTNGVEDVFFSSSSLYHGRVSASGFALVIPSYFCWGRMMTLYNVFPYVKRGPLGSYNEQKSCHPLSNIIEEQVCGYFTLITPIKQN